MKDTWPPRCHFCGRFLKLRRLRFAVTWTPYGDASTYEPPPENYAHYRCWQKAGPERQRLIHEISWSRPTRNRTLLPAPHQTTEQPRPALNLTAP